MNISFKRTYLHLLSFAAILVMGLAACGPSNPTTKPGTWTSYHGPAFTMSYFSDWKEATKDYYLGTHYPQLEMLQGTIFTKGDDPSTSLQVAYAADTSKKASANQIIENFVLDSQSAKATKLTTTKVNGVVWETGTTQVNGTQGGTVQETALGIDHENGSNSTEIYLIIYQGNAATFKQNTDTFFTRMIQSFKFAS